jgi:hypothetical protein
VREREREWEGEWAAGDGWADGLVKETGRGGKEKKKGGEPGWAKGKRKRGR